MWLANHDVHNPRDAGIKWPLDHFVIYPAVNEVKVDANQGLIESMLILCWVHPLAFLIKDQLLITWKRSHNVMSGGLV